jgi:N-acetyl-1-D-myo-inositol-2-amino-2-deoxy-alpha-D-glucopyranoside deacetylase
VSLLTAESVLFIHAHPDDETIGTGGLIAEFVSRGARVYLLTATRGEQGEVVAGALASLAGTTELSTVREAELDAAAAALGIHRRFWLGEAPARAAGLTDRIYADSGMTWISPGLAGPSDNVTEDAFVRASEEDAAADIIALIRHLEPVLVISYDHGGGYGHPDHIRAHETALAASRSTGVPFAEIVAAPGDGVDWYPLPHHVETVRSALRAHATQLSVEGDTIVHSGGQRQPITASAGLRTR